MEIKNTTIKRNENKYKQYDKGVWPKSVGLRLFPINWKLLKIICCYLATANCQGPNYGLKINRT